jgi:hypothetical protein
MKIKFNLVDDTFTHRTGGHTGYSVHGKVSKYVNENTWKRYQSKNKKQVQIFS